jgi:hypothetical protein
MPNHAASPGSFISAGAAGKVKWNVAPRPPSPLAQIRPACGGGLEIAPHLIGTHIQLLPLAFDKGHIAEILAKLVKTDTEEIGTRALHAYHPKLIARAYLLVDAGSTAA